MLISAAACSSSDETDKQQAETQQETQDTDQQTESETPAEEPDQAEEPENTEEETAEETSNVPDTLKDYEESEQLAANIDNLNELNPEVETDNPNKRVILYADDSHKKEYKSIFIKKENRLKIIKLNGKEEGLIFNEIL